MYNFNFLKFFLNRYRFYLQFFSKLEYVCCLWPLLLLHAGITNFAPVAGAEELVLAGPNFKHLAALDNIALGEISQLHYSRRGYLWIGSKRGLIRFDGNTARIFSHENGNTNSLSNNDIWGISEDSKGNLWISTNGGGINKFDPKTESFKHYREEQGLSSNIAFAVYASSNGLILIGTSKGLSVIEPEQKRTVAFDWQSKITAAVWSICEDSENNVWIGSSDGLYVVDNQNNIRHFTHDTDNIESLSNNVIRSIYEDSKGRMWIGTDNGLNLYSNATFTRYMHDPLNPTSISGNEIYGVFESNEGMFWVGTFNAGLNLLDYGTGEFRRFNNKSMSRGYYPESSAYSFIKDDSGTLWVGSENGLVNLRLSSTAFKHFTFIENTSASIVSFAKSKDEILAISESNLFQIEPDNYQTIAQLNEYAPLTSLVREDEYVWLGSFRNGLIRHHLLTGRNKQFLPVKSDEGSLASDVVSALLIDDSNTMWVGTFRASVDSQAGVARYDNFTESFKRYLPGKNITGLLDIDETTLLVGTYYNGLELLNKQTGISESVLISGEDSRNQIRGLYRDQSNRIWVTTQNAGFAEFITSDKSLIFVKDPQQVSSSIKSMASDKNGMLWLSTEEKILTWDSATGKFVSYDNSDGIQLKNFQESATIELSNGEILFGAVGGGLRFNPNSIDDAPYAPKVVINELRLLNTPVKVGELLPISIDYADKVTLSYKDYFFSFSFSALDYSAPKKNHYAYKLQGLDNEWIYTESSNRMATYTSLPPGDYTFSVKATDSRGHWSHKVKKLNITILPPWWKTWAAYSVYLVVALVLPFYLIYVRTRYLELRAKTLEKGIKERTSELEHKNQIIVTLLEQKKRMFTNISHEFRTPLTLILSPVEQLLNKTSNVKEKTILLAVRRNGQRLLQMVEQLLVLARLESSSNHQRKLYSIKQTAEQVLHSFEPLLKSKHQTLVITKLQDAVVNMQPDSIELILNNLISNAIKYTADYGKIEVYSHVSSDTVTISVKDNGQGISVQYQGVIFERFVRGEFENNESIPGVGIGLSLATELIELHGGKIALESKKGAGSLFEVTLPKHQCGDETEIITSATSEITQWDELKETDIAESPIAYKENRPLLLIIEDNADMRTHLVRVLSHQFECIEAIDGAEGIKLARTKVPDIIICDIMMPNVDGYEVSRYIKQDNALSHIPIVLLTAKTDIESRKSGWRENVDDYFTKPFDYNELSLRLSSLLSTRATLRKQFADELKGDPVKALQTQDHLNSQDVNFLENFTEVIEKHYSNSQFQLITVEKELLMSERQIQRKLKAIIDRSFSEYLREHRLKKALKLLEEGKTIYLVQESVGFHSASYFSKCFKTEFGKTPKQFQKEIISLQRNNS